MDDDRVDRDLSRWHDVAARQMDLTPAEDAIAADRETGHGSHAGEGHDADHEARLYERWLDTL